MDRRDRGRLEAPTYVALAGAGAVAIGLALSSRHSYLLFHCLVELTTVSIGFTLFILAWNARRFLAGGSLVLLGIGYAFVSVLDLAHALAYQGMNVFPGHGANLPTQLWIAARSLQAVTLCAAPLVLRRRIAEPLVFAGYLAAVAALLALVFTGRFPDCFVEGEGLTRFKIASEYVIVALLLAALVLLRRVREGFDGGVYALLAASIGCTVGAELSFTVYDSVYGFANMLGHLFKLAAFYLLYRALLVTGLRDPLALIFRDLQHAEDALRKAQDGLASTVAERTAALAASEEKYRALIESANDAFFLHGLRADGRPGPFLEVNQLACARLGYAREELLRMSPVELDDPRCRAQLEEAVERVRREGHAVFETAHLAKDGRSIPVEVSTRMVALGGERLFISLVRDVTERKRAEAEIRALNQELERKVAGRTAELARANKELEAFSFSVSHDLRAPLRAVEGFARILVEEYGGSLDEKGRHYLDTVRNGAARMSKLIEDLLAFSRTGRCELRSAQVDMTALARDVFDEVRAEAPGRTVVLRLAELPAADGDPALLRQVFVNLLSNAVKFTAPRDEAVIEVAGAIERDAATYRVTDNGVGFDPAYAEKLFGVFQRLHGPEQFHGTGIGLAIVKRIVERHGGRVWAEGRVCEGATFHFALPKRAGVLA